ncbi:MAG: hypothetical protein Q8S16_05855 [Polaromonas sp.]|nr:hypothetical protein [Polaromonas sp.]
MHESEAQSPDLRSELLRGAEELAAGNYPAHTGQPGDGYSSGAG